jgi:pyridoxal phosphate-dependent aminotransferase EpsN
VVTAELAGIQLQREAPWATATRWLATIAIEPQVTGITAGELRARLAGDSVQAGPPWTPLHLTGAHRGCAPWPCPVAERFGRDALHLPNSVTLTGDQQNRVLAAVRAAIGQPARA